jgi:hypothetical protein
MKNLFPIYLFALSICGFYLPANACAWSGITKFEAKHGAQGTGNYKGKRDRHENPTPMHEKKRQSTKWVPQKQ